MVVRNAFKARLQALALVGMPYVETSNAPADPSALPDTWMTIEFAPFDERQVCSGAPGANVYRESGSAAIKLLARIGDTETQLLTHAQTIADDLRGAAFSGVVLNEVEPPATSPNDSDGAWREAVVNVGYEYDRYT